VRPLANLVGSSQTDADLVEEVHVEHSLLISLLSTNAISQVVNEPRPHLADLSDLGSAVALLVSDKSARE
jgi:hypothetical protein